MLTVEERIAKSSVYAFYSRNSHKLDGTGLTPMQLLEGFVNAELDTKKSRCVEIVCDYLKSEHTILCSDEQLRNLVVHAYEKIAYYERIEGDFDELPWFAKRWWYHHKR